MPKLDIEFTDQPDGPFYTREWATVPEIGWRIELREVYRDGIPRRQITRVAGIVTQVMSSDAPVGEEQCITVFLRRVDTLVGDPQ